MKKRILFVVIATSMFVGCGKTTEVNTEPVTDEAVAVEEMQDTPDDEAEAEESVDDTNARLEEVYFASIKKLHDESIDILGREVENNHYSSENNKFAIYDIDGDGFLELILSWTDCSMAGMWGGVYQYDFDKQDYFDEGLHEPWITFYDNGVAYEPWRHNQGPGEMWPFAAYLYNKSDDQYKLVLTADSWNKSMREEGFPEDVDTDGAGVVYFTDLNSEYVDYNNPISQSEFNIIYNQYFKDVEEVEISYYEVSDSGISAYQLDKN